MLMKKSVIVLILPTSSQPRFHKRIFALSKLSKIIVFYFRRGLYEENIFRKDIETIFLFDLSDESYFRRLIPVIKSAKIIRASLNQYKYSSTKFYVFSLDCLLIAKLAGIKNGVLEVGDLIQNYTSSYFFRLFEKFVLKNIDGLVLTSKEYYNKYYINLINNKKTAFFFIDNKVSDSLTLSRVLKDARLPTNGPIVIGLVGLLRFTSQILRLISFVEGQSGNVLLKVFGDGPCKNILQNHKSNFIKFYGSFKSPEDLYKIYKQIDLNYVVYDPSTLNVRLALPNKLYESAFFGVPIIVSSNTYLSKIVKDWDIGGSVDCSDSEDFNEKMKNFVNPKWIKRKRLNCYKVPNSSLIDDQEKIVKNIYYKILK